MRASLAKKAWSVRPSGSTRCGRIPACLVSMGAAWCQAEPRAPQAACVPSASLLAPSSWAPPQVRACAWLPAGEKALRLDPFLSLQPFLPLATRFLSLRPGAAVGECTERPHSSLTDFLSYPFGVSNTLALQLSPTYKQCVPLLENLGSAEEKQPFLSPAPMGNRYFFLCITEKKNVCNI